MVLGVEYFFIFDFVYFRFFWYRCVDLDYFDVVFKGFFVVFYSVYELFCKGGIFYVDISDMMGWIRVWYEVYFIRGDGEFELVESLEDLI